MDAHITTIFNDKSLTAYKTFYVYRNKTTHLTFARNIKCEDLIQKSILRLTESTFFEELQVKMLFPKLSVIL